MIFDLDAATFLFVTGAIMFAARLAYTLWSAWDAGRK